MEALQKITGGIGSGLSAVGHGAENAAYYAQLADAAYAGRLPQFLASQSAILQDPSIRNRLMQDPGLARLLGVSVTTPTYPSAPEGFTPEMRAEEFGPAATAPRAQLPPLGAPARLSLAETRLLGQPGMADEAARAAFGIGGLTPEKAAELARSAPEGVRYNVKARGGVTVANVPQTPRVGVSPSGNIIIPGTPGTPTAGYSFSFNPETGESHVFTRPQAGPVPLTEEQARTYGFLPPKPGGPSPAAGTEAPPPLPPGYTPAPGFTGGIEGAAPSKSARPSARPSSTTTLPGLFPMVERSALPAPGATPMPAHAPTATPSLFPPEAPAPPAGLQPQPGQRFQATLPGGIRSTISGPPQPRADFSVIASTRVLPLLQAGRTAVQILLKAGVLQPTPAGSLKTNQARLAAMEMFAGENIREPGFTNDVTRFFVSDLLGISPETLLDENVGIAALFLTRNLPSAVPLLARGFGEQRTNQREEQRLREALSLERISPKAFDDILKNYQDLFRRGVSPGLPGASVNNVYRWWAVDAGSQGALNDINTPAYDAPAGLLGIRIIGPAEGY